MTNLENPTKSNYGELGPRWGWLLALGVLFIILGLIGLGMVAGLTIVSIIFFGVLLIIGGIAHFIYVFREKHWKGVLWHAIIAIFYIIAGIAIICNPILASAIITAFLGGVFIVIGITRLVMAFSFKYATGWGWMLIAGICGIILGIIILAQWPISALWFIGLFIAIEIIFAGWSYVFIALSLRRLRKSR